MVSEYTTITSCLILQELAMKITTTCVENTYYIRDEHACVKICSTKILKTVSEFGTERKQTKYREIIFIGTPNLCSPHHRLRPTVILSKYLPYAPKSPPRPQRRDPALHSALRRGRRRRCFEHPRRQTYVDLARARGTESRSPSRGAERLGERAKQRVLALLIIDKLFVARFIKAEALKVERGPARLARPGLAGARRPCARRVCRR